MVRVVFLAESHSSVKNRMAMTAAKGLMLEVYLSGLSPSRTMRIKLKNKNKNKQTNKKTCSMIQS